MMRLSIFVLTTKEFVPMVGEMEALLLKPC
jgi:hypothetical protein